VVRLYTTQAIVNLGELDWYTRAASKEV
jgi:hypothetical protein